jgi:hypothetical protein
MVLQDDLNPGKTVAKNVFSGKIVEIVSKGLTYLLFIDGIFNLEIEIPAHIFEGLHLEAGSTIKVSLKKSSIHIIKVC